MRIERRFTHSGQSPYEGLRFVKRSSEIRNPDGSTVFKLDQIDIPESWSQLAIDILAQKYFRKAGVPQRDETGNPLLGSDGKPVLGGERDARQVFEPSPAAGRIGAKPTATSRPSRTARRFTTKCATCWRTRWPRRILRSGSIRASTTPMACPVRLKVISTSIPRHAKS